MPKSPYEQRMLRSFLLNYVFTIIIPISIGIIVSLVSIMTMRENANEIESKNIYETVSQVEQQLSQLQNVARFVADMGDTKELAIQDEIIHSTYYSTMTGYIRQLKTLISANEDQLSELYVFWFKNQKIATAHTSYDLDSFYPYFFSVSGMDGEQFYDYMANGGNVSRFLTGRTFTVRGAHTQTITTPMLIYPFWINRPAQSEGCVFILINHDWLESEMASLCSNENSLSVLLSDAGDVIAQAGDETLAAKLTPGQMMDLPTDSKIFGRTVLRAQSSITGWHFIHLVDNNHLMRQVVSVSSLFVVLLLIAVIVGLVISYFLARGSARPLARMVQKLPISDDAPAYGNKAYGQLSMGIDSLLSSNMHLRTSLEDIRRQMPSLFLNRLFAGAFTESEDVSELAKSMGMVFSPDDQHVAVLFEVPHGDHSNDADTLLRVSMHKQELYKLLDGEKQPFYADVAIHRVALLYSASCDDVIDDRLEPFLYRVLEVLRKKGIVVNVAVGSPYTQLRMSFSSYNDAASLLNSKHSFIDHPIVWYWRLTQETGRYIYPSETRRNLVSYAENGRTHDMELLTFRLRLENFINQQLPEEEQDALCDALEETVCHVYQKLSYPLQERRSLQQPHGAQDPPERFSLLCQDLLAACAFAVQSLQANANHLALQTKQYIDEHYMNPDMGLKLVARNMSITDTYLSRIFKEAFHVNFASYVENLRIMHAKEQLECEFTIAQIAENVGYASDHAFRRAFKRVTGINPQECRKQTQD